MAARRGTFAFDLSKPLKRGKLLKQGAFHKAFKHRYFVLYPGFLVYYDDAQKWKLDVTKGNTLGGRLGAIKLKNGTCNLARDAPRGCKFGLIVHAPDPANKRPTYLINATSKDERDEWIAAIKKATPQRSPQAQKKEIVNIAKKGSDKAKDEVQVPPHPTKAERQETANAAALLASEGPLENGDTDKSITSIDDQLDLPPQSMDIRRDTAMAAVLSINEESSLANELHDDPQEQTTSIDDLLGPQNDPKEDSDGEQAPLQNGVSSSPELTNGIEERTKENTMTPTTEDISPDPSTNDPPNEKTSPETPITQEEGSETAPMESSETVENKVKKNGKLEVVTSVTISCTTNSDGDAVCTLKTRGDTVASSNGLENGADQKEPNSEESETKKDDQELKPEEEEMKSSSEVLLATSDAGSFSVNIAITGDSDNTTSDEDEDAPESPKSPAEDTTTIATINKDTPSSGKQQPPEGLTNGSVSPASPTPPAITVEAPAGGDTGKERTGSGSSEGSTGEGRLSPPQNRRKSSTPFIEKTGFLYKMGGKHKNWRRRFFVLKPGGFYYYKKDPSTKPLGEVKLKNMSIFFPGVGERKQSFQFTVHTESSWNKRSDWVFAAQSEREMKEWITAFKLAGQKPGTPLSGTPPSGSDTEQ